jgi:hypothetical protein
MFIKLSSVPEEELWNINIAWTKPVRHYLNASCSTYTNTFWAHCLLNNIYSWRMSLNISGNYVILLNLLSNMELFVLLEKTWQHGVGQTVATKHTASESFLFFSPDGTEKLFHKRRSMRNLIKNFPPTYFCLTCCCAKFPFIWNCKRKRALL